jgi:hypothetical protein
MDTKILAYKLLRKCRKEEVLVGVVVVASQCAEGATVSWAPYLLNLFLDDCKDAQDLGTKFHYSWLLMLIAIMGWKEPDYTFCFHQTQDESWSEVFITWCHVRCQAQEDERSCIRRITL